ncbi:alpha-L-fucosidase [Gelidibacter sp.]|uniref:alpha-L-fucosidase n=1 Tax=Gelidibacter sp. TaxID=2018083 RepID=UPI002BB53438|nr:alpha-L-fucosidase [Gelidibacter sp.]HUH26643.1 alpha-L-fucosidase [Gelidibacter sp.]
MADFISRFLFFGCAFLSLSSCKTDPSKAEQITEADTYVVEENWEDRKFSMFIHWGLYSIPAGIWNDQKIRGYSEQIKGHAKIPTEDYRKLGAQFNPIHWDADEVALLAKQAGMKSIVLTAKHHDGFCLFDSQYTTFDVVDATPYTKDIVKELAEAAKRHNLKFGVYFSLIDWDYEGALPFESVDNSDAIPPLHHEYNLNQIEELLTNYGDISEIWFDMGAPTYDQSKEMATLVKRLQPNCMISGRIWNDQGDFVVMGDNKQPDFKMGVPWQTPASMFNETWSYRSWQERGEVETKVAEKIKDLLKVVSAGGNYLLNIGPKGDGTVIPFEKQVLTGVGEWLEKNGTSIYGTRATALPEQDWGMMTAKPGKLYLHVINFPENNKLSIKGLHADVKKVYPLSDNALSLESRMTNTGYEIDLNNNLVKDKYATTLVLDYENDLSITPENVITANESNKFVLTAENAENYHSYSGHDYYSTKATVIKMKWYVISDSKEPSEIQVRFSSKEKNKYKLVINNHDYILSTVNADSDKDGYLYELTIPSVVLYDGKKINDITLRLEDQSNPHRGLAIEKLEIVMK